MAKINFYTGTKTELNTKTPEDGAIYFVPDEGDRAIIAYDMDGQRYYIRSKDETEGYNEIIQTDGTSVSFSGTYDKATGFAGAASVIAASATYTPNGTINIQLPTLSMNSIDTVETGEILNITELKEKTVYVPDTINGGNVLGNVTITDQTVITGTTTTSVNAISNISRVNFVRAVTTKTATQNIISNIQTGTVITNATVTDEKLILSFGNAITEITSKEQPVVTEVNTQQSMGVSTISYNPITLIDGTTTGSVQSISDYEEITTTPQVIVTGVTTAAQQVVTAITTTPRTIVTGQPTIASFTGETTTISVTTSYTPIGAITHETTSLTVTGKLNVIFHGNSETITA